MNATLEPVTIADTKPDVSHLYKAANQLMQSQRGTDAMRALVQMLDGGAIMLDFDNQRAFHALLDGAWNGYATTARLVMHDVLKA